VLHCTAASGLILVLALSLGCARDDGRTAEGRAPRPRAAPGPGADPCAVALAPHPVTDELDGDITRLQGRARAASDPVAHLERLGWAYVAKARGSFDPGFYTLAEQAARCIAARQPDSPEALLLHGHVLHNLHRFHEGEALARRLVARRGRAADHGLLGDVLLEQGRLDEAVTAYQRMMDEQPGPPAYSRAAHARWLTGDLAGAIALMQRAVGTSGFRDPEAAAWAHVRLALFALQAGRLPEARRQIEWALTLQPEYPPALVARGRVLLAEGRAGDAIAPLERAAARAPLPEYQWALIEALRTGGRAEEARAVEAQLLDRGPASDRRTVALYLAATGHDVSTAVQLAQEELAVRADVFTLDTLAWALHAAGRVEDARAASARAMAQGTQDARLFYHAGVIAAAAGHRQEAARWLARAAASRQTLWPSEREHLARESAVHGARDGRAPTGMNHPPRRRAS
jgi:tetratricopeptide (TPR) repeat protein